MNEVHELTYTLENALGKISERGVFSFPAGPGR
ncbi:MULTISPECIES: DUF6746 family protein [Marinobacter]|nr:MULTISPECIES: DUF6746 family protein [Marinobacter]